MEYLRTVHASLSLLDQLCVCLYFCVFELLTITRSCANTMCKFEMGGTLPLLRMCKRGNDIITIFSLQKLLHNSIS